MSRGDIVRCGSAFLLIWTAMRSTARVRVYPIVAQTQPTTRADYRIPGDTLAELGLPAGPAWIVSLRQASANRAGMVRVGTAPALMLRQLADQIGRVHTTERIEQKAMPTWCSL